MSRNPVVEEHITRSYSGGYIVTRKLADGRWISSVLSDKEAAAHEAGLRQRAHEEETEKLRAALKERLAQRRR